MRVSTKAFCVVSEDMGINDPLPAVKESLFLYGDELFPFSSMSCVSVGIEATVIGQKCFSL